MRRKTPFRGRRRAIPVSVGAAPAGVVRKPRTRAASGLRPGTLRSPARSWLTVRDRNARKKARPDDRKENAANQPRQRKRSGWRAERRHVSGDGRVHLRTGCATRRAIPSLHLPAAKKEMRRGIAITRPLLPPPLCGDGDTTQRQGHDHGKARILHFRPRSPR
jgi:hypothetical protein